MVSDPNFWKRFSVAVHEDEAAKKEMTDRPDLKHSYVPSPSFSSLASPAFEPLDLSFIPAPVPAILPPPGKRKEIWERDSWGPPQEETTKEPPRSKRQPSKLKKSPSVHSTTRLLPQSINHVPAPPYSPKSPPTPSRNRRPSFRCPSSLSLSGRARCFKTWTTITANPSNRVSWLESQKKKSRQRTWICWAFWVGLAGLVAGLVVAILVLKAHHII